MAFIPAIPGVPPLLNGAIAATAVTLLTADLISTAGMGAPSQWGIFLNGSPVVLADTVLAVEYKKDSQVSKYPIEGGGFESYNKVSTPFDVRVTFATGTSDENRAAFLASVEAIVNDYNLYTVTTPEATYNNCNVVHHDYRRTVVNGRGVLAVAVWLEEIRISSASGWTTTVQPSGANPQIGGSVQTVTPSAAQTSAITAAPAL